MFTSIINVLRNIKLFVKAFEYKFKYKMSISCISHLFKTHTTTTQETQINSIEALFKLKDIRKDFCQNISHIKICIKIS